MDGGILDKENYLIECFKNIQELIRFTDQKVAAIIVFCTIEIPLFMKQFNSLMLTFSNINTISILVFITGFTYIVLLTLIFYISINNILKPRFAKHYIGTNSTYYFEHISIIKKSDYMEAINNLDKEKMILDISEQVYEVSKILTKKNINCNRAFNILIANIISLAFYILLCRQI